MTKCFYALPLMLFILYIFPVSSKQFDSEKVNECMNYGDIAQHIMVLRQYKSDINTIIDTEKKRYGTNEKLDKFITIYANLSFSFDIKNSHVEKSETARNYGNMIIGQCIANHY